MSQFPIVPAKVQYVKLGDGGKWESLCRSEGILRFGYETGDPESMQLCREGRWEELTTQWQVSRGNKAAGTRDVREARAYWEDQGDTLWVTFVGDDLCWAFLEPGEPTRYGQDSTFDFSTFRRVRGGWKSVDKNGDRLGKYNLPGYVTKVAAYRRTVCSVEGADSLVARINGIKTAENERVHAAKEELTEALIPVIKKLQPTPFESLIEMVFTRSGWRRVGSVGRVKRDIDISLEIPMTGQRACVQVKTQATKKDLADWIKFKEQSSAYSQMFFVYHSSDAQLQVNDEEQVIQVMDAHSVARHVVEAGLTDWVINEVY